MYGEGHGRVTRGMYGEGHDRVTCGIYGEGHGRFSMACILKVMAGSPMACMGKVKYTTKLTISFCLIFTFGSSLIYQYPTEPNINDNDKYCNLSCF